MCVCACARVCVRADPRHLFYAEHSCMYDMFIMRLLRRPSMELPRTHTAVASHVSTFHFFTLDNLRNFAGCTFYHILPYHFPSCSPMTLHRSSCGSGLSTTVLIKMEMELAGWLNCHSMSPVNLFVGEAPKCQLVANVISLSFWLLRLIVSLTGS